MPQQPKSILVLKGGVSPEREVSLVSGKAVADACRRLGHTVNEVDFDPLSLDSLNAACDLVFPVLHGCYGEDGQLQSELESRSLAFVGSDSSASRIAIDKYATKTRLLERNIPVAPGVCFTISNLQSSLPFDLPVVVKPVDQGSSVGVVFATTESDLRSTLHESVRLWSTVLVEPQLIGPEVTVGIVDDVALPIIEIRSKSVYYDYAAKYTRDDTEYIFSFPDLSPDARLIQKIALDAYHALGCRHYARVDLIIDRRLGPCVLEINTIPGFTSHSLLPKAAEKVGLTFDMLVAKLITVSTS